MNGWCISASADNTNVCNNTDIHVISVRADATQNWINYTILSNLNTQFRMRNTSTNTLSRYWIRVKWRCHRHMIENVCNNWFELSINTYESIDQTDDLWCANVDRKQANEWLSAHLSNSWLKLLVWCVYSVNQWYSVGNVFFIVSKLVRVWRISLLVVFLNMAN